jgi:AraC-like DNA-binding protein
MDISCKSVIYIWEDKAIYIGKLSPLTPHRFPIPVLSLGLVKPFTISIDGGDSWSSHQSVFWPAGYSHEFAYDEDNIQAYIFVEPASQYEYWLRQNMSKQKEGYYRELVTEQGFIKTLALIYEQRPSIEKVEEILSSNFSYSAEEQNSYERSLDHRVKKVIAKVKSQPTDKQSVESLASEVGISKVHLMQLFKQQAGVSIGALQKWVKLSWACRHILAGNSVTEASAEANFSDASHLSRTFRDSMGVSLSNIFMSDQGVEMFAA